MSGMVVVQVCGQGGTERELLGKLPSLRGILTGTAGRSGDTIRRPSGDDQGGRSSQIRGTKSERGAWGPAPERRYLVSPQGVIVKRHVVKPRLRQAGLDGGSVWYERS